MLSAGAALIGILVGALAASVVLLGWSRSRVHGARSDREKLLGDAQREAEALRREAQVEAREQAVALRSEIENEVQDRRVQIAKVEERVLQKELDVDSRLTELERREQGLGDREVHIKALQEELRDTGLTRTVTWKVGNRFLPGWASASRRAAARALPR